MTILAIVERLSRENGQLLKGYDILEEQHQAYVLEIQQAADRLEIELDERETEILVAWEKLDEGQNLQNFLEEQLEWVEDEVTDLKAVLQHMTDERNQNMEQTAQLCSYLGISVDSTHKMMIDAILEQQETINHLNEALKPKKKTKKNKKKNTKKENK